MARKKPAPVAATLRFRVAAPACRRRGGVRPPKHEAGRQGRHKAGTSMATIGEVESPRAAAIGGVVLLVGTLGATYALSQLARNSVGVIAPDLAGELGLSASQIGLLSSVFFFAFAAAQLPLGVALDRYGPKRCMLGCAAIMIAGTLLFAWAATPGGLIAARILMGLGTSCYLMAPLALYAQRFAANRFAVLAGFQLGIGTSGTLLATAPL